MENELTKSYYKIKDAAEFVGVPQSTLRYWEKEFPKDVNPMRNAGNIRYYTPEQIETLRMIKYLIHERGMRIESVKTELRVNRRNISRRMKILDKLTSVRSDLESLMAALSKRR